MSNSKYQGEAALPFSQCSSEFSQCDKNRDSCGQCIRAKLLCPGYHDTTKLVFRDETKTVIHKARRLRSPCASVPMESHCVDGLARELFLAQYVFGDMPRFEYLQTFKKLPGETDHLLMAIKAVSLAYFANFHSAPDVLRDARQKYSSALILTNKVLRSPDAAARSETLLTVLLFDLFEKWASKETLALKSEMRHISGAMMLAQLRGVSQFHDPVGRRMFLQLSSSVFLSCLQRMIEIPKDYTALRNDASDFFDPADAEWQFCELMVQFVVLRAATTRNDTPADILVAAALQLDCKLVELWAKLSPNGEPESGHSENSHDIPTISACSIYPSRVMRPGWTTIRLVRMLLHDTIQEHSSKLKELVQSLPNRNIPEEIEACTATINRLSSEVCDTVSHFTQSSQTTTFQRQTHTYTPSELDYASSLVFPLSIVYRLSQSSIKNREFVLSHLHFLSNVMNIHEAATVRDRLQKGDRRILWGLWDM